MFGMVAAELTDIGQPLLIHSPFPTLPNEHSKITLVEQSSRRKIPNSTSRFLEKTCCHRTLKVDLSEHGNSIISLGDYVHPTRNFSFSRRKPDGDLLGARFGGLALHVVEVKSRDRFYCSSLRMCPLFWKCGEC